MDFICWRCDTCTLHVLVGGDWACSICGAMR